MMKRYWWILPLGLLMFGFGLWIGVWCASWWSKPAPPTEHPPAQDSTAAVTRQLPDGVSLRTQEVQEAVWQDVLDVSGRTTYDETRYVEVVATAAALVQDVCVAPGDRVTGGQILAWLHSAEVAAARAEVVLREEEKQLAERRWQWDDMTLQHVEALIAAIEEGVTPEELERRFADRTLGEAREKLLGAYSRLRAADMLVSAARPLAQERTIPLPTLIQRDLERQSAAAALLGLCERMRFELRQTRDQSQIALHDAERRVAISRQRLTALLGYEESPALMEGERSDWARYSLRAPVSGTVERRYKAIGERVQPGEPIFAIADTSKLWCRADVREQDWLAIRVEIGQQLEVQFPGTAPRSVPGQVVLIGREVSPQTNTIPLVLSLYNDDGSLRPGMFARLAVPRSGARRVVRVPASSVLYHEGEAFVFVVQADGTYERRTIVPGDTQGDWVQVEKGLRVGERVVVEGGFVLKSILLLDSISE